MPQEIDIKSILFLIENDKIHLDAKLSLPKMAELLDTTVHNLSYTINQQFKKHFFDFINQYRVEEAKLLLAQKHRLWNLEMIAFKSGFGNKSSFNRAFKKATQSTPSQYRTSLNQI